VAACYAVATALIEPVRTYLTTRALGISPWRVVRAFGGVAQGTAIMAAVVLAARAALIAVGVPAAPRLGLLIVLGAVTYLAACLWRAPEVTIEVKQVIAGRRATARVEAVVAPL
jgi:hypothetical protein